MSQKDRADLRYQAKARAKDRQDQARHQDQLRSHQMLQQAHRLAEAYQKQRGWVPSKLSRLCQGRLDLPRQLPPLPDPFQERTYFSPNRSDLPPRRR